LNSQLVARSITAAGWGLSGTALRIVLQVGAQVVLARILGPAQYGLFAIGVLVISLSSYFADSGVAYGLVQRTTVSELDIRYVFTWQVIAGSLVTLTIIALAPTLARLFQEPRAESILKVLSSVSFISALSATSMNLLKRNLDHRNIQIGQVLAYAIGYVAIGIPLALTGLGVWSLVIAWLVVAMIQLIYFYHCVRHSLRPLLQFAHAKSHMNFGGIVFLTNLVNWFITNVDKAIAARFFPGTDLGLYSTSFNLLNTPTTAISTNLQSVVFAASAQVQGNATSIKRAYLKLLGLVCGIFLPAFGSAAVIADTLIIALYGPAWADAAPMITAFACGMPLLIIWAISTPVLWNTGQALKEIKIQLPILILWVTFALLVSQYSIVLLAWALTGCFLFRVAMVMFLVCHTLDIRRVDLVRAMVGPTVVAVLVVGGVYATDLLLTSTTRHALLVLTCNFFVGSSLMVLAFRLLPWSLSPMARALLAEAFIKTPMRIRPFLVAIAKGPK
jgi:lipopolysaccharide exporter